MLEDQRNDGQLDDEPARMAALQRYDIVDTAPESAFDKITALIKTVLDVPIATVTLVDAQRQWFKSKQGLDVQETARDISFCTHTIQARTPMIIPDASADPRFRNNPLVTGPPHIMSYAGVPLVSPDGYNVGALCAIDRVPRQLSKAQIDIMVHCAALVVDELELRLIANRDYLTGVLTRRGLIAAVDRAIAERNQQPSTLLLLDLDRFKAINDRFGHGAGDHVLKAVARTCTGALGRDGIIGRVGGEEFAVLLPGASIDAALQVAERLRAAIEAIALPAELPVIVTASFGVAPLDAHVETTVDWLHQVDLLLYDAKNTGRNRVCAAPVLMAAG